MPFSVDFLTRNHKPNIHFPRVKKTSATIKALTRSSIAPAFII